MLTAQLLADVSPFSLGLAVAFMLLVESLSPLVPLLPPRERARHTLRNLSIAVFLASVAVIGNLLIMGLAAWGSLRGYGLLNLSDTPWPVRFGGRWSVSIFSNGFDIACTTPTLTSIPARRCGVTRGRA